MEGQTKHQFWLNTIKTDYVVAATSTSFAAMDVANAMVSCINMSLAITVIVLFPLKLERMFVISMGLPLLEVVITAVAVVNQ